MTFKQWWSTYSSLTQSGSNIREDMGLLAFTCWALWKARNKDHFDHFPRDPSAVLQQSASGWNEFLHVHDKRGGRIPPCIPPPPLIWKPPDGNFIKINVDGALNVTNKVGGLGLVARDSSGSLLGAKMHSRVNLPIIFIRYRRWNKHLLKKASSMTLHKTYDSRDDQEHYFQNQEVGIPTNFIWRGCASKSSEVPRTVDVSRDALI
ncbi:hypothetical protein Vadar_010416 [Vaccinium darrowii]|uniref:Uncharacterized protein n=1 Tax=Vaccinium darrowii TaxID=229202 RepID=A0ACB7ZBN8_9ERIC|nr:hypothetical protein Vadar_010416 [Vaccinium darrowii]